MSELKCKKCDSRKRCGRRSVAKGSPYCKHERGLLPKIRYNKLSIMEMFRTLRKPRDWFK